MSLTIAMKTATSGLVAAQTAMRTVSDNIANVNTPGYVRKTIDQQQLVVDGMGMGVEVSGVKRVTDQYLQLATLSASSDSKRWEAVSQYLDNAQSLFGDPSSDNFFFTRLDDIWAGFAAAANDPSSSLLRGQAVSNVEDFLNEAGRINGQLSELGRTVDSQITADVSRINDLLKQIDDLNSDVSRAKLVNADASGAENIQSGLIDELATLMNVQVEQKQNGGVTIRSTEGTMLAGGGNGAATITYNRTDATKGYVAVQSPGSNASTAKPIEINGGQLRGLMDLRDDKLPGLADQLGEFVARTTEQINRAHNAASAVPAPASLTGRNTGLDDPTVFNGFTGKSTIAIVDSTGAVTRRVDIDFDAGQMTVDGVAGPVFTPGSFMTDLNASLSGAGTATFTNGVLQINADSGGVAIDEGTSQKAGRGFSQFFGLNDMIRSTGMVSYETGLSASDPHGFTPGDIITFRLAQGDGKPLRDVTVTVPAAPAMSDLLTALNSSASGVGLYGQFTLDAKGTLSFAGTAPSNATLSVVTDETKRGVNGPSISVLFGIGTVERSRRANNFFVDKALSGDPTKLALAKLDLSVTSGPALRPGDGSGALGLAAAGDQTTAFSAAGTLGAVNMTLTRYASEFGGSIGRDAAAADTRASAADAVMTEATQRRQAVEGVNLDEELVRLTTYQQAFSASARMIQAAKEMIDTLVNII